MTDTALNALRRAQFDVSDILRRAQGDVVGAFGLDPQESPHQIITLAHTGVFATMAATTDRDLCSSLLRRSKDHTSGTSRLRSALSVSVCTKACMSNS